MEIALQNGCMFLVNGLLVPPGMRFEGQPYSDGWRLLRSSKSSDIDGCARDCGWNFFFMAEVVKRTMFGLARGSALRRAATRVLAQAGTDAFNAVEITEITARKFLGLHWVTVAVHLRSLQKSSQLKDLAGRRRQMSGGMCAPGAERL